ncbi:MAG: uroporphyrinogen-III synthase [Chloroflexota bacterium]
MALPLSDRKILVTRAAGQNHKLIRQLNAVGAQAVECPTIQITPPDNLAPLQTAIQQLQTYQWLIFTSVNGVSYFWRQALKQGLSSSDFSAMKIAAVGPATENRLRDLGLSVNRLPREYIAEALVEAMGQVSGQRILIPTANIARPTLTEELRAKGAIVDQIIAYQTQPAHPMPDFIERIERVDTVTFTSSSTVSNFVQMCQTKAYPFPKIQQRQIASIGPKTTQTAIDLGLPVHIEASSYTIDGLVEALVQTSYQSSR